MASTEQMVRLQPSSYDQARVTLGRAFFDYPLMVYALADERRRAPAVTHLYGAFLHDCFRWGEVYVTPEIDGVCGWLPPQRSMPTFWRQARSGMLQVPLRFGWRGFRRLIAYDEVAQKLHHDYASMPHWYLQIIAVEPERQGRGIGSALIQPMLARIDDARLHCWLDTHREQNVRLYQRHGFEIARLAEVKGHPVPVWGMLRKPR